MGGTSDVDIAGVGGALAAAALSAGDPEEIKAGMADGEKANGGGLHVDAKEDMRNLMNVVSGYDNTGADSNEIAGPGNFDANQYSHNPNQGGGGDRMDGNMPKGHVTAEDTMTSQLFNDYEKFVTEGSMQEASNAFTQTAPYPSFKKKKPASHQEKTTMKHVKNPTAGEKKAAKDIKAGTAGYKDRIDMLKSAEKDGRLKND
jgi:hypothetical protein